MRDISTEIALGRDEGLGVRCAASFDNLQRIQRSALSEKAGELGTRRGQICDALRALADC